jgi:hypothetical protein
MVAISYFFYKHLLVDFSVMFYVYTKEDTRTDLEQSGVWQDFMS